MHGAIAEVLRLPIEIATTGIEVLAVMIIIAGVVVGTARFIVRGARDETYNEYKEILDKALLLGLNILVAADIVRTVALDPTITNILGLGLLVLVRTFLSWALFVELNERWPWQRSAGPE
jgi:uncharacterized membrane protein